MPHGLLLCLPQSYPGQYEQVREGRQRDGERYKRERVRDVTKREREGGEKEEKSG